MILQKDSSLGETENKSSSIRSPKANPYVKYRKCGDSLVEVTWKWQAGDSDEWRVEIYKGLSPTLESLRLVIVIHKLALVLEIYVPNILSISSLP